MITGINFYSSKTNGELLELAIDCLKEFESRGNKQIKETRIEVERQLSKYTELKERAKQIEKVLQDREEYYGKDRDASNEDI